MKHAVVIPRNHEHAAELNGCGEVGDRIIIVDRDSACYQAWVAKHRPPKPPRPALPIASDEEIQVMMESDRRRGPCCSPPPKR
jgi:hypothetical protein